MTETVSRFAVPRSGNERDFSAPDLFWCLQSTFYTPGCDYECYRSIKNSRSISTLSTLAFWIYVAHLFFQTETFGEDCEQAIEGWGELYPLLPNELGVFASTYFWCGRFWLSAMWRGDDVARPKVGESPNKERNRTVLSEAVGVPSVSQFTRSPNPCSTFGSSAPVCLFVLLSK